MNINSNYDYIKLKILYKLAIYFKKNLYLRNLVIFIFFYYLKKTLINNAKNFYKLDLL